jgi:hypothetical protein
VEREACHVNCDGFTIIPINKELIRWQGLVPKSGLDPRSWTVSCFSLLRFANTDVSSTKIYLDTLVLAKSIMDRREY